jgi:ketosteroid isomerase-like protein
MSNLETVQAFYESAKARDLERLRSILAPQLSWKETPGWPEAGVYRTPDEVLKGVFARLGAQWDDFKGVPEEFLDAGEKVVVLGSYSGTSKATGRSFVSPFAHVWVVRDGAIVELQQYADTKPIHDAWKD